MGSVTRVRRTWKVVLVRPVNVVSLERINMRRTGWGSLEVPVWIVLKPALRFVSCIFSFLFFFFFFFVSCSRRQLQFSYFFVPLSHQWIRILFMRPINITWRKTTFNLYIFRRFLFCSPHFIFIAFSPYPKKLFRFWSLLLHQKQNCIADKQHTLLAWCDH